MKVLTKLKLSALLQNAASFAKGSLSCTTQNVCMEVQKLVGIHLSFQLTDAKVKQNCGEFQIWKSNLYWLLHSFLLI